MKRWIWAAPMAAAAATLALTGLFVRLPALHADPGADVLPIDFGKLIRGKVETGTLEQTKCVIENSVPPDTVRTTDARRGLKLTAAVVSSDCDETPSRGDLNGVFEAELSGFEKRCASGGDAPPRPAVDQPEKDNRGVFRGKWRIRNSGGTVVADGVITLLLHVNAHYPPAIPDGDPDCFVPQQLEGFLEGAAILGDSKNCRVYATLAGRSLAEAPAGVSLLLNAEGLVLAPCDNHGKLKLKARG